MPQLVANGIEIEFQVFGPTSGEVVMNICGLGAQLTAVPTTFVHALVARGYRVIRFDNRDAGRSTKMTSAGLPDFAAVEAAIVAGRAPPVAYTLADMALDAVGLLDALNVERAHLVGGSMGGMIAQLLAAEYPERVASLLSYISTSGNPALPTTKPDVLAVLTAPPPALQDFSALVNHEVKVRRVLGSPGFPTPELTLRDRVERDILRSYDPAGTARQSAAIMASGDRRPKLRRIRAPTVVVHGDADRLIPAEAAVDTAANIADAELRIVEGLGHDFPDSLAPTVAAIVGDLVGRARRSLARA